MKVFSYGGIERIYLGHVKYLKKKVKRYWMGLGWIPEEDHGWFMDNKIHFFMYPDPQKGRMTFRIAIIWPHKQIKRTQTSEYSAIPNKDNPSHTFLENSSQDIPEYTRIRIHKYISKTLCRSAIRRKPIKCQLVHEILRNQLRQQAGAKNRYMV